MKSLEAKIRLQDPKIASQKTALRVLLSKEAFYELGFNSGQTCALEWDGHRREAIAWPFLQPLAKNIVILSRAFQELCGLKLSDQVRISPVGDTVAVENVFLRDISEGLPPIEPGSRQQQSWQFGLERVLFTAEHITPGMVFKDVVQTGPKRSFIVESVNNRTNHAAKFGELSVAQITDGSSSEIQASETVNLSKKLEVSGIPGIGSQLEDLNSFFAGFGVEFGPYAPPPAACAVVIQGSPGTGKTMLLDHIAATNWGKVYRIEEEDKVSTIQDYFKEARQQRSIILIDDIQYVTSRDRSNRDTVIRTLRRELDALATKALESRRRPDVVIVATCIDYQTDVPNSLQQGDRFRKRISLPVPDATARAAILRSLEPRINPHDSGKILSSVVDRTHAYTGRDLWAMLASATEALIKRTGDYHTDQYLTEADVDHGLKEVRPTAMHDINLKPPTVRWGDIGGYLDVKKALQRALRRDTGTHDFISKPPKGILLYGPPGCSKTMTAQAVATESGFNFLAVKGPELLNMYVGETERALRNLFQKAREVSPSIIFFDEIDSIAGSRSGFGKGPTSHGGVQTITALLTEMDGFEELGDVFVLAATNKPDSLDPALLRPGRFDQLIYVPLPDIQAREAILSSKAKELRFKDIDISVLAAQTDGFSGAEISKLCDLAFGDVERNEDGSLAEGVNPMEHLENKFRDTPRLITADMLRHFEMWLKSFKR